MKHPTFIHTGRFAKRFAVQLIPIRLDFASLGIPKSAAK
jgi:hypothetical protein